MGLQYSFMYLGEIALSAGNFSYVLGGRVRIHDFCRCMAWKQFAKFTGSHGRECEGYCLLWRGEGYTM
jgi:hypothetical protein